MTFDFLRRKPEAQGAPQRPRSMGLPDPGVLTEEPPAEDYELKLTYRARSSKGVRFRPGEGSVAALPRMLEEHTRIRAATETLRIAAREEKAPAQEKLAETLAAHAQTEEEVLYPAAILVGDIIRARMAKR